MPVLRAGCGARTRCPNPLGLGVAVQSSYSATSNRIETNARSSVRFLQLGPIGYTFDEDMRWTARARHETLVVQCLDEL